jgi:hypothetical protein
MTTRRRPSVGFMGECGSCNSILFHQPGAAGFARVGQRASNPKAMHSGVFHLTPFCVADEG